MHVPFDIALVAVRTCYMEPAHGADPAAPVRKAELVSVHRINGAMDDSLSNLTTVPKRE